MKPSSEVLQDNLNVLHSTRRTFIASENDEKIKRALCQNIRTSVEVKYVTGDNVFYKREDKNEWRGPGVVIGQVNQQVFVKHGTFYIRVHPCRLQLVKSSFQSSNEPVSEQSSQYGHNHQNESNTQNQQTEINSSSDSENESSDTNEAPPQNQHSILVDDIPQT